MSTAVLPLKWWKKCDGGKESYYATFKDYSTRRDAEDAAARAWVVTVTDSQAQGVG